jgi:hypothetical protein
MAQQVSSNSWFSAEADRDSFVRNEQGATDILARGGGQVDVGAGGVGRVNEGWTTSGCGCSWNCDEFFVSEVRERLLEVYGWLGDSGVDGVGVGQGGVGEVKGAGGTNITTEVSTAGSLGACCRLCRSRAGACNLFSYNSTTLQCRLRLAFDPKTRRPQKRGRTNTSDAARPGSTFGNPLICSTCAREFKEHGGRRVGAGQAGEVRGSEVRGSEVGAGRGTSAGRWKGDADEACLKERAEVSVVGITPAQQEALCRRFLRAATHDGFVMSLPVLQYFMGAKVAPSPPSLSLWAQRSLLPVPLPIKG